MNVRCKLQHDFYFSVSMCRRDSSQTSNNIYLKIDIGSTLRIFLFMLNRKCSNTAVPNSSRELKEWLDNSQCE